MTTTSPLRVLIISKDPTLLDNRTGFGDTLKRHIYYAERLSEQVPGSELRILTYSKKNAPQKFLSPSSNIKIFGTASAHRALFLMDALRHTRTLTADGWIPTVITTQEPYEDGHLGLLLSRRYNARFIPQLHFNMYSSDWSKESFINPIKRYIAARALKKADVVRVVSNEQKRQLIRHLEIDPERISVIPVGVTFKQTNLRKTECKSVICPELSKNKVVLFVGRIHFQKNLGLWIEVAKNVLTQEPDTRFLLAGDGPMINQIKSMVEDANIASSTRFLGNVPYKKLPEIYGAADLFLLTSHYEGMPRVVVEAGLARLPVITTKCGPEDVVIDGQTGFICNKGDLDCLTERVLLLLRDDVKREQFSESAFNHIVQAYKSEFLADSLINMWAS